jgi:DNA ligase (NAD+)
MGMLMAASREELQSCEGVGDIVAASIHSFLGDPGNRRLIAELASLGLSMEDSGEKSDPAEETSFFAGKNFVITGTFHAFTREELKQRIERAGGSVRGSVSAKTHALIVGENPGSKLSDAVRLGIQAIGEEQLATLLK